MGEPDRPEEEAASRPGTESNPDLEGEEAALRRYEELFRDAPVPYLITDTVGRITMANLAAATLLRVPVDHVTGMPLGHFVVRPEELGATLARLARRVGREEWETELRPRGSRPIPVLMSAAAAMTGPAGSGVEVRWVLRDMRQERATRDRERHLSREQAARAALEEVASRARFLSGASGRLMGVLNAETVWQIAARLAESYAAGVLLLERKEGHDWRVEVRAAGGTPGMRRRLDALVGQFLDLRRGGTLDHLLPLEALRSAVRQREAQVVPGGEGGSRHHGSTLVVPLIVERRVVGLLTVWLLPEAGLGEELLMHRNLAERIGVALEAATLFEEVVRARRRAEEASAAEADFLAMVSHELRTPLTAIVSYAELLEAGADQMPPNLSRYAHQIAGAAKHQRQLVEQILSYKQVQRGDLELAGSEELDFRDVVQFSVAMVRPQAEGKPMEVMADVPPHPVPGICDPGKLRQVLANLLSNAIRHTERGYVRLSLCREEDRAVLVVEDTGEGIRAEDLPRIFDRFWRGVTRDDQRRGSGLGLTITRELVTRMGGKIEVQSEVGAGSRFTVRLPLIAPEARRERGGAPGPPH